MSHRFRCIRLTVHTPPLMNFCIPIRPDNHAGLSTRKHVGEPRPADQPARNVTSIVALSAARCRARGLNEASPAACGSSVSLSVLHAIDIARELRRHLGLYGPVDAEAVANGFGLVVVTWPFRVLQEMQLDGFIAVAQRLNPTWRRWVTAHAIGHHILHPGNHIRMRRRGLLYDAVEREAEEFAGALLVDAREALALGVTGPRNIARHFGVPEEMVRLHVLRSPASMAALRRSPRQAPCAGEQHPAQAPAPSRSI